MLKYNEGLTFWGKFMVVLGICLTLILLWAVLDYKSMPISEVKFPVDYIEEGRL